MIKVIEQTEEGIKIQTSEGGIFFIKENKQDITISSEPLTVLCWKGKQYNNSLNLEDVELNIRTNQPISKFYELDYLLTKNDEQN